MPGVSSISRYGPSLHPLVGAGDAGAVGGLGHAPEPFRRLMKVLFPTLGMPITISAHRLFHAARSGALHGRLAWRGLMRSSISLTRPPLELKRMAMTFFAR